MNKVQLGSAIYALTTITFLLISSFASAEARVHSSPNKDSTDFIRTHCSKSISPASCVTSLSPYASTIQTSHTQLVKVSLSLSLSAVNSALNSVRRLPAAGDCTFMVGDAVTQLQRSLDTMGRLGVKAAGRQMSDVKTWVSSALTDEKSCLDELTAAGAAGGGRAAAKTVARTVERTCDALSFVNALALKISGKKGH